MFLSDIRIIDLNHSEWDKKTSKPEKGQYEFTKKIYTNQKMADTTRGLDFSYKFKWNTNNEKAIRDWRIKYGFELVTVKDPSFPEGAELDAEGKWIFGDAVLMKIPLRKYAEKQMRAEAKSNRAVAQRYKEFQATLGEKKVQICDEFIEKRKAELGIKD